MIGVGGKQFQECGRGMGGITDGNVQFVCCDDAQRRVAKLPPELVSDGGDFHRRGGSWSVLDRVNHSGSSEKQNDDDQDLE